MIKTKGQPESNLLILIWGKLKVSFGPKICPLPDLLSSTPFSKWALFSCPNSEICLPFSVSKVTRSIFLKLDDFFKFRFDIDLLSSETFLRLFDLTRLPFLRIPFEAFRWNVRRGSPSACPEWRPFASFTRLGSIVKNLLFFCQSPSWLNCLNNFNSLYCFWISFLAALTWCIGLELDLGLSEGSLLGFGFEFKKLFGWKLDDCRTSKGWRELPCCVRRRLWSFFILSE